MAASGSALAALVQSDVNSRMGAVQNHFPLAQKRPEFFVEMCQAIGTGIISGGPVIMFTTTDSGVEGSPLVPGTGAGVGIVPDPNFFITDLYTRVRGYIIADFGKTSHDPYPPQARNSGLFLLALCQGINDAFQTYYPTAWTLVSTHPQIYMGTGLINNGQFSGLSASAIKGAIIAAAPRLRGRFWPRLAQAISESYVALIQQHSTGQVTITGTCIPGPSQVCGIGGSGSGTGTAT
ncbi:MAG: hypothetical protein OIN85_00845 [Candidatus Methanoperedens sp.]|nr:hypothetical protein [Candidatus Methanoperedens sp.]